MRPPAILTEFLPIRRLPWRRTVACAGVAALLLAGCADDGSGATTPTGTSTGSEMTNAADEYAAYCEATAAIDQSEQGPTPPLIQAVMDAAPDEIADEVTAAGNILLDSEGNLGAAIADSAFQSNIAVVEPVEDRECGPSDDGFSFLGAGDTAAADGATVVEVTTQDYAFLTSGEVAVGTVAFEVTNSGPSAHELFVGKLADGVTLQEVLEFEGDPFEAGMVTEEVGFAFVPTPGDTRYVNADLSAGTYAFVCFIPGPEGTPHAFLGMASELTVAG